MPKKKQKRKPRVAAYVAQTESTSSALKKGFIKWASISVILAILLSVMIAAISVSPAKAATPITATPSAACVMPDTDGDGITNDIDSDIDGDSIVNGLDPDIDGDGLANAKDGDPAATNCNDTGPLPILPIEKENQVDDEGNLLVRIAAIFVVAGLGIGYLVLRRIRGKKK